MRSELVLKLVAEKREQSVGARTKHVSVRTSCCAAPFWSRSVKSRCQVICPPL